MPNNFSHEKFFKHKLSIFIVRFLLIFSGTFVTYFSLSLTTNGVLSSAYTVRYVFLNIDIMLHEEIFNKSGSKIESCGGRDSIFPISYRRILLLICAFY